MRLRWAIAGAVLLHAGAMALLFVLLALSMFGLYELQLPARLTQKQRRVSSLRSGGNIKSNYI